MSRLLLAPVAIVAALAAAPAALAQDVVPEAPLPPAPTVALTSPADGADVGAATTTQLAAHATGATTIVSFHVDGRLLCVDLRPPFGCAWAPTAAQMGDHLVEARASDPFGRTAASVSRVTVGRLLPDAVTATTTHRKRGRGWRLTTAGAIAAPVALAATGPCGGTATVTVRARGRILVDRTVSVGTDCRFTSAVAVAAPRRARSVEIAVAFEGAQLLAPRSAPRQTIRLR